MVKQGELRGDLGAGERFESSGCGDKNGMRAAGQLLGGHLCLSYIYFLQNFFFFFLPRHVLGWKNDQR